MSRHYAVKFYVFNYLQRMKLVISKLQTVCTFKYCFSLKGGSLYDYKVEHLSIVVMFSSTISKQLFPDKRCDIFSIYKDVLFLTTWI